MKNQAAGSLSEGQQLARRIHLRYVTDEQPGFSRRRNGSGFQYFNCRGQPLKNKAHKERINNLVIPPAWQDVWICQFENGHLQATGFDARKRKQYLYHQRWQEAANLAKFSRLAEFGQLLPSIRRKIQARLKGNRLDRERVLAGIIAILDATSIRVGNEEYVAANNSFGLTTLRNRHLAFEKGQAVLKFRGKSGVTQELLVKQKNCVRLLRQCRKLSGQHVFQYWDETGKKRVATSSEVNEFLQDLTGENLTAKDFRTWAASAHVVGLLYQQKEIATLTQRKRIVRAAVKSAAEFLGNTVATARKYYIHPELLEIYELGDFPARMARFSSGNKQGATRDEKLLAYFLRRSQK
jgi:DNA topoisomerase I